MERKKRIGLESKSEKEYNYYGSRKKWLSFINLS